MTWQPRINPLSRKLNILCKKKKKSPVALLSIRLWFQVEHIWGFLKCREKHFKQENKKKDPLVSNKSPSSSISVGLLPWLNRNSHTSYNTPSYQISPPVFCSAFSASPLPFSSRTKKNRQTYLHVNEGHSEDFFSMFLSSLWNIPSSLQVSARCILFDAKQRDICS